MTKKDLFVKAHINTREDKKNYPEINYRVQFGLNLKALYVKKMMIQIKLEYNFKGSEKQIKWAQDIMNKHFPKVVELLNNATIENTGYKKQESFDRAMNIAKQTIEAICNEKASYIIDKRNEYFHDLLDDYRKNVLNIEKTNTARLYDYVRKELWSSL